MDDDYDLKFSRAIAELANRAAHIKTLEEGERCLKIHEAFRKATPEWAEWLMQCIHEVIIKRMWDIMEIDSSGHRPGVYVILFADGHIKIGRTKCFSTRLKHLTDQSSSAVENHEFFPCNIASKIEATAHRFFANWRIKNEFFKVDFEHACEVIRSLIMPNNEIKH